MKRVGQAVWRGSKGSILIADVGGWVESACHSIIRAIIRALHIIPALHVVGRELAEVWLLTSVRVEGHGVVSSHWNTTGVDDQS